MASRCELRLEQAQHQRPGGFVLGPISLKLTPGVWRVVGPPGSGKTALLRMIGGDLPPSVGRVVWNGLNMYRKEAARRNVALVLTNPEQPDFFTVEESWRLAADLRGKKGWEGLALQAELGLDGRAGLSGLAPLLRRRAELLAALAGDPDLIVLDDVFTALDIRGRAALCSKMEEWRERRVIVMSVQGDPPLRLDGEIFVNSLRQM